MANTTHIEWLFDGHEAWNAKRAESDFTPDFSGADLYQIFRDADNLNGDGDIPLAGYDLRRANFADSRLNTPLSTASADLRGADLRSADFRAANLPNAKLDDADLRNAGFGDADLASASLRGCPAMTTRFPGANLFQADLRGAKLQLAYLQGADLCFAKLDGAELTDAVLVGADLSCSRPWTSKLFSSAESVSTPSDLLATSRINCIAELLEHCSQLRDSASPDRVFYFRGERDNAWKLEPSVMRSTNGVAPLRAHEGEMLLELMSKRPEDFAGAPTALAQWVLAQHHGLKTRLLDITRNPLVALLGACGGLGGQTEGSAGDGRVHVFSVPRQLIKPFTSDTVAVISNIAKLSRLEQDCLLGWTLEESQQRLLGTSSEPPSSDDVFRSHPEVMRRLYHLVRHERPHFMERIDPRDYFCVFVVEPLQSFERIRAQSGAFLISAFHERFERDKVLSWNDQIPLYDHVVLDVPSGSKEPIVRELDLLGVTRESLLPGLDEAANAITRRFSSLRRSEPSAGGTEAPDSAE